MRVLLCYCSADKPTVLALAEALRARGFETWLDVWEMAGGQGIVARINQGLAQTEAAIVVCSHAAVAFMSAEVSYQIWAHIQEGKHLIPVLLEADAPVPALLRPLAWRMLDSHDEIAAALRAPQTDVRRRDDDSVLVRLRPGQVGEVTVEVQLAGTQYGQYVHPSLPRALGQAWASYRGHVAEELVRQGSSLLWIESALAELGAQLAALCLPGESGAALTELLDGCPSDRWIEVVFEAEGGALLALPFEALTLPDGRPLALHPSAVTTRRPYGLKASAPSEPMAGPLKILVAVAAPDEGKSSAVVLDLERELQVILDALADTRRDHDGQVRFLEIGHPREIAAALGTDAYNVLHLSCHGQPGLLFLEDEDGNELPTTAADLLAPLKGAHHAPPLVLLNTCHGGSVAPAASSLAEDLLRAGLPGILAMTDSVSNGYAVALTQSFYRHLQQRGYRTGPALAAARRELEEQRRERHDGSRPEYATASLFLAGKERPLLDANLPACPLSQTPVHRVPGPVPQLALGDLVGRRAELRRCLRLLNQPIGGMPGLVLTGIGGIGKSSLAGRIMVRQRERGWLLVAQVGRWDLADLTKKVADALANHDPAAPLLVKLHAPDLDDLRRQMLLHEAVDQFQLLLVLDDFEQNLTPEGEFLNDDCADQLQALAANAGAARLLLTSRPFPQSLSAYFAEQRLVGLSRAESGKLISRLPQLSGRDATELARIQNLIGGHPRLLELLDALLNDGQGRLRAVCDKLEHLLQLHGQTREATDLADALQTTVHLGLRDILLEQLLALATARGDDELLYQAAVSRLPTSAAGLVRILTEAGVATASDPLAIATALTRLTRLTLLQPAADDAVLAQRWTAQGLAELQPERYRTCCLRAARYRRWRRDHESYAYEDLLEALRNALDGEDYDMVTDLAKPCFTHLSDKKQSWAIADLAAEILATLPSEHNDYCFVADKEAQAQLAHGLIDKALHRSQELLERHQQCVIEEPDSSRNQRNLAVSYIRLGDLYREVGQGEEAPSAYAKALASLKRLARQEPGKTSYQRDLAVSYERIGDIFQEKGWADEAATIHAEALAIRERLSHDDPDRADLQRDLSVSYERMGDLLRILGRSQEMAAAFDKAFELRENLVRRAPEQASLQRALAVSYERKGDHYLAMGRGKGAAAAYANALAIRERLAHDEPGRADFQRELAASHEHMGDLHRVQGRSEEAMTAFTASLAIRQRLAKAEPERADLQRELSVSYQCVGDLYRSLGRGEEATTAYTEAVSLNEYIAFHEPGRASFQRDLAVSYNRMGDLYRELGRSNLADVAYHQALKIRERLTQEEPKREDNQHDLSVSYIKLGDLYRTLGRNEEGLSYYAQALTIAEHLAGQDPERTSLQRELTVPYERMGDLYRGSGQFQEAATVYAKALAITERLAGSEPGRADFQHDLVVSYIKTGDLHFTMGRIDEAVSIHVKALELAKRLASREPDRADLQRDLATSYNRVGDDYQKMDRGDEAASAYTQALAIRERLASSEPGRADLQHDLSVSYECMGKLYLDQGQKAEAKAAFQHSLDIMEALVRTEPKRADFLRSLAVKLHCVASADEDAPLTHLRRACELLLGLKQSGRLRQIDEPFLEFLQRQVVQFESAGGS